jgi:phosphoglycerate dehydrogenase-like enzyme
MRVDPEPHGRTTPASRATAASRSDRVTVGVVTPLEGVLVDAIRRAAPHAEVLWEPELLPPARYPGDHRGVPEFRRDEDAERRWQVLLKRTEVLFGLPGDSPAALAEVVRTNGRLRWVQGTAAGTGEQVKAAGLNADQLERVAFTSASGVHVGPLTEFCMLGLLMFTRGLARLQADQGAHRWDHYPVAELRGRTVLILGLGAIGNEIARLAKAFGMHTLGVNRHGRSACVDVDAVHSAAELHELLGSADAIVSTLPLTVETRGLLDARAIAAMKRGAILINVGRGETVDETALVQALRDGRLGAAALDVFATEPLPRESPLWDLPNVLISPHTAALSRHENDRIVELVLENLSRYLAGEPLLHRVDPNLFY